MSGIDDGVAQWRAATTSHERALWERLIFDALDPEERRGGMPKAVHKHLPEAPTWMILRRAALLKKDAPPELWRAIDDGRLTLTKAAKQLAKPRGRTGTRAPAPEGRRPPTRVWKRIRAIFIDHVARELAQLDEPQREKLSRQFLVDIAVVFEDWSRTITRLRGRAGIEELRAKSTGRAVAAACATLGIRAPKRGELPDMEAARKARRRLARIYHPDVNGGTDATRESYHAVNDAFRLLETHTEDMKDAGAANHDDRSEDHGS